MKKYSAIFFIICLVCAVACVPAAADNPTVRDVDPNRIVTSNFRNGVYSRSEVYTSFWFSDDTAYYGFIKNEPKRAGYVSGYLTFYDTNEEP